MTNGVENYTSRYNDKYVTNSAPLWLRRNVRNGGLIAFRGNKITNNSDWVLKLMNECYSHSIANDFFMYVVAS